MSRKESPVRPAPLGPTSRSSHRLSAKEYAFISLAGLGIAIGILCLFIFYADKLVQYGIQGSVYYFLLIPLGLASAAFLFGSMRSHAEYRGKVTTGAIELGGPILGASLVVVGAFLLARPSPSSFTVTLRFHGPNSRMECPPEFHGGKVFIDLNGDRRLSEIDKTCGAEFKEIPSSFRNKKVPIDAVIDGWTFRQPIEFQDLGDSVVYLEVVRLKSTPDKKPLPKTTPIIAVLPFKNLTGSSSLDYLESGIAETVTTVLAANPDLRLVERTQMDEALRELKFQQGDLFDQGSIVSLGKLIGAHFVIVGSIQGQGRSVLIVARRIDIASGGVSDTVSQEGPASRILALEQALAEGIMVKLHFSLGNSQPKKDN
jgi:TolB-like protein